MATLSETQEIIYLPDCDRAPLTVLRLYLTIFLHTLYIKISLRGNFKKLSPRNLFGSYYLFIIRHICQKYRIISRRSTNTGKEEATFNSLKKFENQNLITIMIIYY